MRNIMILVILLIVSIPLSAQVKVAYVNVDSLLNNCTRCKEAEAQYEAAMESWDSELQAMATELETLQSQLEMPLSDTRKQEVQAQFDEKKRILEARQIEIYGQEGAAIQLNYSLMMPLLEQIQKSMEKYALDNGIHIISDGETGEILYMAQSVEPVDATGTILDIVNAQPPQE